MSITNTSGINLALAVWLLHDEYDYVDIPNYISATRLMKPLRQIILPSRVPPEKRTQDVQDFIARALGHSLHDSIEKAWKKGYKRSLKMLGYPESLIERVRVNPTPEEAAEEGCIPVYLEQRATRELDGHIIGGKFDMVAEGIVHDNKTTSAYTWLYGGRDSEHQLQGSIYRWLNPDKITSDFIRICYIFTDWQKATAKQNPNYPQSRVATKDIPLLSLEETEHWLRNKLSVVKMYGSFSEDKLPECTDEELWRSAPQYKYYSDPTKTTGRSTKNFDSMNEAKMFQVEKGGKGVIIPVLGEPKRCGYCEAYDVCSQKDKYFNHV
jgi:hypothetical protein